MYIIYLNKVYELPVRAAHGFRLNLRMHCNFQGQSSNFSVTSLVLLARGVGHLCEVFFLSCE